MNARPKQLLYSRKQVAVMLGNKSVDWVKLLEKRGYLTPIRFGKELGQVFYAAAQVHALAQVPEPAE